MEENQWASDSFKPNVIMIGKKTPYALLQEILSHNKIVPKPTFSVHGAIDSQLFTFGYKRRITLGKSLHITTPGTEEEHDTLFSIVVTGESSSGKKAAQHSAAVTSLNYIGFTPKWVDSADMSGNHLKWQVEAEMFNRLVGTTFVASGLPELDGVVPPRTGESEKWITRLKDFAVESSYTIPQYKLLNAKPPSHQPTFTMSCEIREEDSDKVLCIVMKAMTNQKQLRRMLAQKLLMQLYEIKGIPWDGPPMPPGEILEDPAIDAPVQA